MADSWSRQARGMMDLMVPKVGQVWSNAQGGMALVDDVREGRPRTVVFRRASRVGRLKPGISEWGLNEFLTSYRPPQEVVVQIAQASKLLDRMGSSENDNGMEGGQ